MKTKPINSRDIFDEVDKARRTCGYPLDELRAHVIALVAAVNAQLEEIVELTPREPALATEQTSLAEQLGSGLVTHAVLDLCKRLFSGKLVLYSQPDGKEMLSMRFGRMEFGPAHDGKIDTLLIWPAKGEDTRHSACDSKNAPIATVFDSKGTAIMNVAWLDISSGAHFWPGAGDTWILQGPMTFTLPNWAAMR